MTVLSCRELTAFGSSELIMNNLVEHAREAVEPFKDPGAVIPDPSHVLQLSDDVYTNSNLFALQKSFDGEFQFDVFFESASAKQKLSCKFIQVRFNVNGSHFNFFFSIHARSWHPSPHRGIF